jgi:hypothetical protein
MKTQFSIYLCLFPVVLRLYLQPCLIIIIGIEKITFQGTVKLTAIWTIDLCGIGLMLVNWLHFGFHCFFVISVVVCMYVRMCLLWYNNKKSEMIQFDFPIMLFYWYHFNLFFFFFCGAFARIFSHFSTSGGKMFEHYRVWNVQKNRTVNKPSQRGVENKNGISYLHSQWTPQIFAK